MQIMVTDDLQELEKLREAAKVYAKVLSLLEQYIEEMAAVLATPVEPETAKPESTRKREML